MGRRGAGATSAFRLVSREVLARRLAAYWEVYHEAGCSSGPYEARGLIAAQMQYLGQSVRAASAWKI